VPLTDPTTAPRQRVPLALVWLALLLAACSVLRAWMTQAAIGAYAGCDQCLFWPVLGHDAWLLAAGWSALALAAFLGRGLLRITLVVVALAIVLLMAIDLAILITLNMRLYLFDVFKFGMEAGALRSFLGALLRSSGGAWLLVAVGALLAACAALRPRAPARRTAWVLVLMASTALVAGAVARRHDLAYINSGAILNVVELHFEQGGNRPYSERFVRELAQRPISPAATTCSAGLSHRPNIIVLAVESLSSYQSTLFGGPMALTPTLDAIASEHTWFSRFHANGFSTDAGLIALLTGEAPIPAVGRYRSVDAFTGFDDPQHSVAVPLKAAGYSVSFFTSGDLGFLDKGPWLKALGFDHWEGAEHPAYAGWPRGAFSAAEDRALYERLIAWMDTPTSTSPWFAFVLTVQSHPPFVDPASGRLDEGAVFAAVDREIGRFHDQLRARGFFDDGILIITGDHRSMTPLHVAEREAHGDRAFARVPMIVIGDTALPRGRIDTPLQQTDLLPSLADLTAASSCRRPDQGWFLRPAPVSPDRIVHARGDARNRIDFYFGDDEGSLILAGDDTHWIGTKPPQWQQIEDQIHRDRLRRGVLDSDIAELIRLLGR
jgi:lipoteichoic acid synthase